MQSSRPNGGPGGCDGLSRIRNPHARMEGIDMASADNRTRRFFDCSGLTTALVLLGLALVPLDQAGAQGTVLGEIEQRPAPVARRMCVAGTNAGALCNDDGDCPGASCRDRNIFNLSVAVHFDATAAELADIENMITAGSATLFDVTDGQAQIGQATIHNHTTGNTGADVRVHPATCTAGADIGAACSTSADCANNPGQNDGYCGVWWSAYAGAWKVGGYAQVSINHIQNAAFPGNVLTHELAHLIFDALDEYENRQPNCGAVIAQCRGGVNAGNNCATSADCPGSLCDHQIGDCPHAAAGQESSLMDANGTELCWGQADPSDLTDLSGGNHDPSNQTEQSSCRNNRSVWDQVVWSWPSTFAMPAGAPDPDAGGAVVKDTAFVRTSDQVRVVLVLDESGSMYNESPSRMQRLKVAAKDFIALADDDAEVGIISYATNAETASGRARLVISPLGSDRSDWTDLIDGLAPSTRTNIGAGLDAARELIMNAGGVTASTYVVLMTDGLNNEPGPQANADADLSAKVATLLGDGIPVYVTCTGSDLGLPSQCSEIASGSGGHYTDSADGADLALAFADFHERISGHQAVGSATGDLVKKRGEKSTQYATGNTLVTSQQTSFYIEPGSRSASFLLQWSELNAQANLTVTAPDDTVYDTRAMSLGRFLRLSDPIPGEWTLTITGVGTAPSPFVARAYVRNPANHLAVGVRYPSVIPDGEIRVFAYPTSRGLSITSEDSIIARVMRPDGTTDTLELHDRGRDASGRGDDVPGDGIFTGDYAADGTPGAYQFLVQADIDGWPVSSDAHEHRNAGTSARFTREVRTSTAAEDPNQVETTPEDDRPTLSGDPRDPREACGPCDQRLYRVLFLLLLLSLLSLWLIWRCTCMRD
jgi:Mg-chelatase subunit ChlD